MPGCGGAQPQNRIDFHIEFMSEFGQLYIVLYKYSTCTQHMMLVAVLYSYIFSNYETGFY